jgi:hypothetical protein
MRPDEITVEHLVARSQEGPNSKSNYALSHYLCNIDASVRPLMDKIRIREAALVERLRELEDITLGGSS